jgi:hypothetical protein
MEEKTTEDIVLTQFKSNVEGLISTMLTIHDKAYGSMSTNQIWFTWISKFSNFFSKINLEKNKSHKIIPNIIAFYNNNINNIVNHIFVDTADGDCQVMDEWLLEELNLISPGDPVNYVPQKKFSSLKLTPNNIRCKGHVIYFNEDPKCKCVSIPLSEAYITCTTLCFEKGNDDKLCRLLPSKLLVNFFGIIYYALKYANTNQLKKCEKIYTSNNPINFNVNDYQQKINNDLSILDDNINKLKEVISLTQTDEEEQGSGMSGLGKMMKQLLKSAGIDKKIDEKSIQDTIDSFIDKDTMSKVKNAASKVFNEVKNADDSNGKSKMSNMMSGIGKVLMSQDIQDTAESLNVIAQKKMSELSAMVPTLNSDTIAREEINVDDQE